MHIDVDPEPFHRLRYVTSGRRKTPIATHLPFHRGWVAAGALRGLAAAVLTADLQGRERGLPRPGRLLGVAVAEELARLAQHRQLPPLDQSAVVVAGDLYDHPDLRKRGGTGAVDAVWRALRQRFRHVVGVAGNHDLFDDRSEHAVLDGDVQELDGLRIGGVSGIIGRPDRPNRSTEAQFGERLQRVLDHHPDLVVTHLGPDDPARGLRGSSAVRELLTCASPSAPLVFGHCHWPMPATTLDGRSLVNVDGRVVVVTERSPEA